MLACARIGAAHCVVFGGFSRRRARRPDQRRRGEGAHHRRRRLSPRRGVPAEGRQPTWPSLNTPSIEHVVVVRRGGQRRRHGATAATTGTTTLMAEAVGRLPGRADGQRAAALPALHLRHDGQAEGHHAHHAAATSPRSPSPTSTCSTSTPTPTCTGARPTSAGSPATATSSTGRWPTAPRSVMYEGVAQLPGQRPLVGDRREVQGDDLLHRADGHPHVHEVGRRGAGQARPVVAAPARLGRRADQPRGVDVVPRAHRRRPLPDRRHVVADRDRRRS